MSKKVIAIFLTVALVASLGAFLLTLNPKTTESTTQEETTYYSYASSEYTNAVSVVGNNGEIYLPTPINGIYYTANLSGDIAFYEYINGAFLSSSYEMKTVSVKMSASTESIPVKISYIVVNGQTIGYGLFTSDMNSSVDLYDYAFVELRNMPSGYGSSYLILSDYDKEDFYSADKTYNEIYEYNLKSSSVSTKLSQNTRLIDHSGTYRQDWSMLSDEFIANLGSAKYFMSSRYYTEAETGIRTDIMVYSNAYRPTIVAEDIIGEWFVNDDNGIHYLTKSDNGFKSVAVKDKKTSEVATFEGDFFSDYLRSGNYIVNKNTNEMTNLLTGESKTFKGINITSASVFSLNSEATKAVFASKGEENSNGVPIQKVTYCSVDGSEAKTYEEPLLWSEEGNFVWLDSSNCMSVRATSEDGAATGSVIYTY